MTGVASTLTVGRSGSYIEHLHKAQLRSEENASEAWTALSFIVHDQTVVDWGWIRGAADFESGWKMPWV
jgi:hypothetical protein